MLFKFLFDSDICLDLLILAQDVLNLLTFLCAILFENWFFQYFN